MKRPLAYITAPWGENEYENTENAARWCRQVVCGGKVDETVKNDIATAERLRITATTLDGILTVKGQGRSH